MADKKNDPKVLGRLVREASRFIRSNNGRVTADVLDDWCGRVRDACKDDLLDEIDDCIASRPDTGGTGANLAVMEMCLEALRAA